MNLNDRMEFDHVIQVHADGSVTDTVGGLERDILATPGYYVALVAETYPEDDDSESEPIGWAVAYREVT